MTSYDASLPYASVTPSRGASAWAGTAIISGGLALVLVGGCFLIGVLVIVSPQVLMPTASRAPLTGGEIGLMAVLYLLSFLTIAGGATLLYLGARGLLRLLNDWPGV